VHERRQPRSLVCPERQIQLLLLRLDYYTVALAAAAADDNYAMLIRLMRANLITIAAPLSCSQNKTPIRFLDKYKVVNLVVA